MSTFNRFIGGSFLEVAIRLVVISFIVGIVLSALNLDPLQILDGIQALFVRIYEMGWGAIEWAVRYLLLGAVIVVPLWLISRVLKLGNRG